MSSALLLGIGLLVAAPSESEAKNAELVAYQAAKANAGRDAGAHVRLALWCESRGMNAERLKHLALALLSDPKNATARGLMGLVAFGGRWQRPDAVSATVKADEAMAATLAEYNARRARTPATADAHWKLALWCEQNGLAPEALAHFTTVTRLDPGREAAWKKLGCRKVGGRWQTEAQIEARKADAEAQKKADKHWRPLLAKWRGWLGEKAKRAEAESALGEVTDPRAVPAVWEVFVASENAQHTRAVQLLGQIDSPGSSRALAVLSIVSASGEARRAAVETLRRRDPRDFLHLLIGLIRDPVKYEVRPVGGPGSPGALFVAGKRLNVQRLYAPPPMPNIPLWAGEPIYFDQYGLPVVERYLGPSREVAVKQSSISYGIDPFARIGNFPMFRYQQTKTLRQVTTTPIEHEMFIPIGQIAAQYQLAALSAQEQLNNDVRQVESYNASVRAWNEAAVQVLKDLTGQDLGQDPKAWASWWVDQQGYTLAPEYQPPIPTVVQNVPLAYVPPGVTPGIATQMGTPTTTSTLVTTTALHHNCFASGTPVRTLDGLRPIESIRVGDQVLTQDTHNGALGYQPVVAVYHNRPSATLKIAMGRESVVATTIHRFWKVGNGWTMARDLKPGDSVRTLGGTAVVTAVEPDQTQPVFNLQAAGVGSFFVGASGTLVHDNSLVEPVTAPFDAPPTLAVASPGR